MESVRGSDLINQQADINTPPHTHHHHLSPSLSPPSLFSPQLWLLFLYDSLVVLSLLSIPYRLDLPHFLHKPHFAHFFPYKTPQNSVTPTYKYTIQIPLSLSISVPLLKLQALVAFWHGSVNFLSVIDNSRNFGVFKDIFLG